MKKIFLLLIFTLILSFGYSQDTIKEPVNNSVNKNTRLITDNIDIFEVFGPVLPIALSPFFGVAITSLASILAKNDVFENEYLSTHPLLNNWPVLVVFLLLTILTALPKYTKITGQFALIIAKIEDYAGLIILLIIQIIPQLLSNNQSESITIVHQAGFFEFSYTTLIAVASVANMYVIKVVRFFFDFLIYLSPIPAVDAVFDNIKKGFIIFIISLYAINPLLAFIANVLIFLMSAIMFSWVNRRVVYFENIYIDPRKAKILKKYPHLVDKKLPRKIAKKHEFLQFAVIAFPLKRMGAFKRKMKCWLVSDNNSLFLYKNRFILKPRVLDLNKYQNKLNIGEDIFWIRVEEPEKYYRLKLDISNIYKPYYEDIKIIGDFNDLGDVGAKDLINKAKNAVKDKTVLLYNKIKSIGNNDDKRLIIEKE